MKRSLAGRCVTAAAAFLISVSACAAASKAAPPAPAQTAVASEFPTVGAARIVGDDKRTRFVADVSRALPVSVFTLADPYRVVIDLPEVYFGLGAKVGEAGRGLISAFRYGLISPGKSRVVIDVKGPVKVDKSFVLDPIEGEPARLVVDVVPTTRTAFLAVAREYRDKEDALANAVRQRALVPLPPAPGGKLKIVLDPGHGGIDAGASGEGKTLEKDVTLAFARVLGRKLGETGHYEVFMTREDDSFVSLGDRVTFARQHGADLFVSIHANSFFGAKVSGAIVYTISDKASDKMAEALAAKENQADVLAGVDLGNDDSDDVKDILVDLTRRETRNFGVVFARNLVKELKVSTRMFKIPHQTASFKVLEAPDVPSAMIELGYLTNKGDEELMKSAEWRETTGDSVVRAVDAYFKTKLAAGAE
ncbi:MAG: N-acetylmuramoyl-L-alanine amidase [Bauldia sp.]